MTAQNLLVKVLCVTLVAAVMLPAGTHLFPYVSDALSGLQFRALEAVVSASIGFAISALVG